MLKLPDHWTEKYRLLHTDVFSYFSHLTGEIFREQKNRKTLRFIENQQAYFIKIHTGTNIKEIFKNISQAKLPVIGAKNEINALLKLASSEFVPALIGYGFQGKNPLTQRSFVITQALDNTISLEDFCKDWKTHPPALVLKWALIKEIARIAKVIHDAGINHRDFYLCHFLLEKNILAHSSPKLYVIDWHRAQIRKTVPLRWRIKDMAGLYFSAMDIGLTQRDLYRFQKIYDFRDKNKLSFWQKVSRKAFRLYCKIHKTQPLTPHGEINQHGNRLS